MAYDHLKPDCTSHAGLDNLLTCFSLTMTVSKCKIPGTTVNVVKLITTTTCRFQLTGLKLHVVLELLVVKDKVGTPQVSLGYASPWNEIFSLQCFDIVGWATGRASGV